MVVWRGDRSRVGRPRTCSRCMHVQPCPGPACPGPSCLAPAVSHVRLKDGDGWSDVYFCIDHLSVFMTGCLQEHPLGMHCGMPGAQWDIPANECLPYEREYHERLRRAYEQQRTGSQPVGTPIEVPEWPERMPIGSGRRERRF